MKIIKYILIGVIFFSLVSCKTKSRTDKAVEWINSHPKPITIISVTQNEFTYNYICTFIDANGEVFYAGEVNGFYPCVINAAN